MNALHTWGCRCVFLIACCTCLGQLWAQTSGSPDTLQLNLQQAEHLLISRNLFLVANHFKIDISRALVLQSKYWDNPTLYTDQNLYDGKFFDHSDGNGQIYIQLQQLIKTAGKRKKLIQLSNDEVLSSEQEFNDLMRNLDYLLTTDFNTLAQLQSSLDLFEKGSASLQQLSLAMEAQFKTGNISSRENLRVKGLLFLTESEKTEVNKQISDLQRELQTMLSLDSNTMVKAMPVDPSPLLQYDPSLQDLLDTANRNRPDLALSHINKYTQEHNVSYQKALSKPDLNVGVEYDKSNSYVPNYWGLVISFPVPILNRNKGNIRAAEISVEQAGVLEMQSKIRAEQEVIAAYKKFKTMTDAWKHGAAPLEQQYDAMLINMTRSYQERQIGLLEFIDFFQSYKEIKIRRLQQSADLLNAAAELNFTTGHHYI
jgi:cobalt-zinc-cadmium efflux system outer membrane protein